jgi:hypothetical protein
VWRLFAPLSAGVEYSTVVSRCARAVAYSSGAEIVGLNVNKLIRLPKYRSEISDFIQIISSQSLFDRDVPIFFKMFL